MVFLMLPGKIVLLFPKNTVFVFGHKMENDLSQKLPRNIILSVCLVKMRFFFSLNMILLIGQMQRQSSAPNT